MFLPASLKKSGNVSLTCMSEASQENVMMRMCYLTINNEMLNDVSSSLKLV
jgi:hypothetical protein